MPLHSHDLYDSLHDIPDVVPPQLWLPENSRVRIVKAAEHTPDTTTPVEAGFAFYELRAGGFIPERILLEVYEEDGIPNDFLNNNWGNHIGRIMLKAILDPDRLAPIDFVEAYRQESRFRGYSEHEETFFVGFARNWGVLKRLGN